MRLIKASYEILPQAPGLEGAYKHIELAGRTCYKSHDKITEDSSKGFVDRMIKSNHLAMCEHGSIYLKIPYNVILELLNQQNLRDKNILDNHWVKYAIDYENDLIYISSNFRWIIENGLEHLIQYLCEPTEHHEKRITVKFILPIGISREFIRHRVFSFAEQSTRYCNFSKNQFGSELTFIEPCWDMSVLERDILESNLSGVESNYMSLIDAGWKAQQAREVLPLCTKTELIMTGFISDWKHFFDLRADGTTGAPHPQAKALVQPLKEEFIKLGYVYKITLK